MKKTIFFLFAFLFCLTSCVEPLGPNEQLPKAEETGLVAVTMQLTIPQVELMANTKANTFSHNPQIESIHVAVFGISGYPQAYTKATPVGNYASTNYGETAPATTTVYEFKVLLPLYEGEAHVHIIANGPESIPFVDQTEDSIMSIMETTNDVGAFWTRVVLPDGILAKIRDDGIIETDTNGNFIPTDETSAKFKDLTLIRNFAQITLNVQEGAGIELLGWTLVNTPVYGSVAPMKVIEKNGEEQFEYIDDYKDYTYNTESRKMENNGVVYNGYMTRNNLNGTISKNVNDYTIANHFCYERVDPNNEHPTFILMRARFLGEGEANAVECYYRVDLNDEILGGYFPLYRNYKYQISIHKVGNKGETDPEEAALHNSGGNMSISAETATLTDVSDGVSRLYVEFVEKTFTNTTEATKQFWTYYVPDITNGTINNDLISVRVKDWGTHPALKANSSVTKNTALSDEDLDVYDFTLNPQNNNYNLESVIEVKASNNNPNDPSTLYRYITVRVMKTMSMGLEFNPNPIVQGKDIHTMLHIKLKDTLQQSMFPLEFEIEDTNRTLNPTGKNGKGESVAVPVKLGTSIYNENNTQSYHFIRTVNWSEYEPMVIAWRAAKAAGRSTDDIIDFTTEFKTTEVASATKVYVDNEYFNMKDVELENSRFVLTAEQTTVPSTTPSVTVHVDTDDNVSWEASVDNGATLSISRAAGNGTISSSGAHDILVSFGENNTFSPKVYTVTVTGAGKEHQITITQEGRTYTFTVSPATQTIKYYQTTAEITVNTDAIDLPWTVSANNGASVSTASGTGPGTVTITVPYNYSTRNQQYNVTITPNNTTSAQKTVTITQSAATSATLTITSNSNSSPFGRAFNGETVNYENSNFTASLENCVKGRWNAYFVTGVNNNYGKFTIKPTTNRIITRVVITYNNNYMDNGATVSAGEVSRSGNTVTWDMNLTDTANGATYTASNGDARVSSIQVYYGTTN